MSSRNTRSVWDRFSVSLLLYVVFRLEYSLLQIFLLSRARQSDEKVPLLFTVSVKS